MSNGGLPGVSLDPKAQDELEAAFGVTSNAEELVRQNRARFSKQEKEARKKRVNPSLTSSLYTGEPTIKLDEHGNVTWGHDDVRELKGELEESIGHPIKDAVVRGNGRSAAISYVFVGPRGGLETDVIPYVDVFGESRGRSRAQHVERTPEGAAEGVLQKAEEAAEKALEAARAEAVKLASDARDEALKVIQEAEAEAQKIREAAAEEAPAAAEAARAEAAESEDDDVDPEADAKSRAAQTGSSRRRAKPKS